MTTIAQEDIKDKIIAQKTIGSAKSFLNENGFQSAIIMAFVFSKEKVEDIEDPKKALAIFAEKVSEEIMKNYGLKVKMQNILEGNI